VTVWLTLFLDLAGFGVILPVLPYYAESFGASPATVALLATVFSAAQFVMSPVLGRLSDRVGRRPVMLGSIGVAVAAMVLLAAADALWMVFAARIVSGMGKANVSTANAYVADRVPPEQRAKYMGIMGAAIGSGFVVGPALGGLLSTPDWPQLPFVVAAGLSAVNFLMAFVWLPESRPEADRPQGPLFPFRPAELRRIAGTQVGWLVLLSFLYYLAFSAMESTLALSVEARFGWTARETGLLFTGIGVVVVVVQGVAVGRAVRRFGERPVLIAGFGVLAGALYLAGATDRPALLAAAALAMAAGNGLSLPSLSALVSRNSSTLDQGYNLGLGQSAAALARMLGPVAAGPLFEALGPGVPMVAGAGAVGLGALLAAAVVRPPPRP